MADVSLSNDNISEQDSQASSVRVSGDKVPSDTSSSDSSTAQSSRQDVGTCAAVARNTSDLSYDISSASEEDSVGELTNPKDNSRTTNGSRKSDPCLSFDEECRELLAAMSMRGSVDGDDDEKEEAAVAEDIDDKEGDLPDVSPIPLPQLSDEQPKLETVAKWIKDGMCRNIVVLSGAGVSCAAGIPDFRTPGTGL